MTSGDERRAMPPSGYPQDGQNPYAAGLPNPFAPVSMENRITGNGRNRRRMQAQPMPGSSYGYPETAADPATPPLRRAMPYRPAQEPPSAGPRQPAQPYPGAAPYEPGPYPAPDDGAPCGYSPPDPQAALPETSAGYAPRHVRAELEPIREIRPEAENALDPWEALGWKAPKAPREDASLSQRYDVIPPGIRGNDPASPYPYAEPSVPYPYPESGVSSVFSADAASQPYYPQEPLTEGAYSQPYYPQEPPAEGAFSQPYYPQEPPAEGAFSQPYYPQEPPAEGAFSQPYYPQEPPAEGAFSQPYYPQEPPAEGAFSQPYFSQEPPAEGAFSQPYFPQEPPAEGAFSQPYFPQEPQREAPPARREKTGAAHAFPKEAAGYGGRPDTDGEPQGEAKPPRQKRGLRQTVKESWRLALIAVLSLTLVFCVIEVARIIRDLAANEQEVQESQNAYYAHMGIDPESAGDGVELLPAGQTYAPAVTAAPVKTPTPEPKIDQNDPLIGVVDSGGTADSVQAPQPSEASVTRTKQTQYPNNPLLNIDSAFDSLRAENTDVVGTLTIDGVLSETLVKRNNTYYLAHNARGKTAKGGAIFVDESCVLTKPPENLLLRGQTTVEGKLFQPLMQYGTTGVESVSRNAIVTCHTLYENAQYVIFAVIHADSQPSSSDYFNYAGHPTFQTDAQMLSFVQTAKQHSLYNLAVGVHATDRLLTLATLPEGSDTRCWVLLCRKLRDGESTSRIQTD